MSFSEVEKENSSEYILIQNEQDWKKSLPTLKRASQIAIDIEASTTKDNPNEVCLIQISTPSHDYLLDTIICPHFYELGNLLANPKIEKIFHACEFDLRLLWNQFQWQVNNLFDTMWAGKLLGYKQLGLAYFLDHFFHIKQDKKHQKSNWKQRPLTQEQLEYAFKDSHYLIPLADILKKELHSKELLDEAKEIFSELAYNAICNHSEIEIEIEFWKIIGNKKLPDMNQQMLFHLLTIREQLGKELKTEPKSIISNKTLLRIALQIPKTVNDLKNIPGTNNLIIKGKAEEFLNSINENNSIDKIQIPPRPESNHPKVINRVKYLTFWRKKLARSRQLYSDAILSKNKIVTLAMKGPYTLSELKKLNILGPIQYQKYAEQIIKVIKIADKYYEKTPTTSP